MDEKKLSMLVIAFVFIVAISSVVFMFSDAESSGRAVAAYPVVLGMEKNLPDTSGSYAAQQNWQCPAGSLSLSQKQAKMYLDAGRNVERYGDVYCYKP